MAVLLLELCAKVAAVLLPLVLILAGYRRLNRDPQSSGDLKKRKKRQAPVAGTLFHQLLHFNTYHDYMTGLHRKHTTFRLTGFQHDELFTVDSANIEYLLKTNFSNFGKGWFFNEAMEDFFGDGIFVADGDKWRQQRKLASFEFSTKVLRDFSTVVFKRNAAKLAQIVSNAVDNNEIIDMQAWFMKSTMDSIFKVAFGVELNCLSGTNVEGSTFTKAFDDSSVLLMWRFLNPLWKVSKFLNLKSEVQLRENIKVVDDFIYKLIANRTAQKSCNEDGETEREDILSRFIVQSKNDPENMTQKYLRDIILNFVIAGKDTTAGTLSWFLCMLCKHPSIQEKIAVEVSEMTKSDRDTNFEEFAMSITEETLSKMHYLHATLTETLRLYPAVPSDSKVCFSDDVLPDGFSLKKGDVVTYQPYSMGRMKYIWGDDAEVFRPERWLDDNGMFRPESPFKFTAFQAGPRICLGKEFAYRQMKVFAAVLLFFFRFELGDAKKEIKYRTMLTLHIDGGLHLRASRR